MNSHEELSCIKCGEGTILWNGYDLRCTHCSFTSQVLEGIALLEDASVSLNMHGVIQPEFSKIRRGSGKNEETVSAVDRVAYQRSVTFVDRHIEQLGRQLDQAVVADLGCGQIPYITSLRGTGIRKLMGFDLSLERMMQARQAHDDSFPLELFQCGAYRTPLPDESVDIAISCEVLEHLEEPHRHLKELRRILKPGGVLSLSTPCVSMYFHPKELSNLFRGPASRSEYLKRVNSHTCWSKALGWHPALRPKILAQWISEGGFEIDHHSSTLWNYGTAAQPVWRLCRWLEGRGMKNAAATFSAYLDFHEALMTTGIVPFRWFGVRQFVMATKSEQRA